MTMKRRPYRKRKVSSSESDEDDSSHRKVSDIKEDQQLRCKRGGISAVSLATGRIVSKEEEISGSIFRASSKVNTKGSGEKYGLQVGNAFSAESHHKEEDQLMGRYIKDELAKRRGS